MHSFLGPSYPKFAHSIPRRPQIPYIGLATANFALMFLMALFVFQVPLRGSFFTLLLGVVVYVSTTTAYGMLISAFAKTQIAALFATAILTVLAGDAVRRPAGAGVLIGDNGANHGAGVSDDLFSTDRGRHFYQGVGLC